MYGIFSDMPLKNNLKSANVHCLENMNSVLLTVLVTIISNNYESRYSMLIILGPSQKV